MASRVKSLIVHPTDPLGKKISGIGTFLKGFIKHSPEDFGIEWIGITSDKKERRIGMWQEVSLSGRRLRFFPALYVKNENVRKRIPLSLRFTVSLFQHRFLLEQRILEFHRIEPSFPFYRSQNKKLLFIHGNMKDLYNPHTEVKWRMFPRLYFQFEKRLIKNMEKVFVVREDAVSFYKSLYPSIGHRFSFMPAWVDEENFYPYSEELKKRKKGEFLLQHWFNEEDRLILFVGRLEGQKDPLLLIETFRYIHSKRPSTKLLIVGTGSLKKKMKLRIRKYGLEKDVKFLGIFPQSGVAEIMRISDVFILTSGFEGMPRSVLESLACGLPVVSMDVGEVKKMVINGFSGKIVTRRTAEAIGQSLLHILANREEFSSKNCVSCIENYTAKHVLEEVYETYYQILKKK